MAHKHSIYDTDTHFVIDPITRSIACDSKKVQLMQNDHNSERFTFEIPRYVEGHDMSQCDSVQVHYINTGGGNSASSDVYTIDDIQLSPNSEDVVIGSWLISGKATMYSGTLNFSVRFVCFDGTNIEYQWFTDIYTGIKVCKNIYNSNITDSDEYQNSDLIESWKREILSSINVNVDNTTKYATEAKASAEQAERSATIAAESANNALTAASMAGTSANKAAQSELNAASIELSAREECNNAVKYSKIATEVQNEAIKKLDEAQKTLEEASRNTTNISFGIDFESGNLVYSSPNFIFDINEQTGNLEWEVK